MRRHRQITLPIGRLAVLGLIAIVAVVGSVGYVAVAAGRDGGEPAGSAPVDGTLDTAAAAQLVYRNATPGPDYGRVGTVPAGVTSATPSLGALRCDRIDVAGDRGVCLRLDQHSFQIRSSVEIVDSRLQTLHSLDVPGYPSRTRVSPDGRYASTTTFV